MTAREIVTEDTTTCDTCSAGIQAGDLCYLVGTGRTYEGLPVVQLRCEVCQSDANPWEDS